MNIMSVCEALYDEGTKTRINLIRKIDFYKFIQVAMSMNLTYLIKKLVEHPLVNKLYLSIRFNDIDTLSCNLLKIDPRSDNHKAYLLALETRNSKIIELVKYNIIRRNLFQQKVFQKNINKIIRRTDLPET
jgi:hypothetical protein